jgi:CubicO group peptidase (beta-lactamase class C family)
VGCQPSGQETSPAPEELQVAGEGLTREGLSAIQEMLETAVADGRIPSAVASLHHDGARVWLGTAGEMGPGVAMREDAILPLASVGKMFTATAAMILHQRGVISLSDPVGDYIPEFFEVRVEVTDEAGESRLVPLQRPVTVYDLLTHSAGLTVTGDQFWEVWDEHAGVTTTAHFARALAGLPFFAHPGEEFRYGQTGASYEVLAAVIEIASEQTLEVFMNENIFEPLGLSDSYFFAPEEKSERVPAVYRMVDGVPQPNRAHGEVATRSTFFYGGGGVRSTADDVLHFARLFLEGGAVDGVRILEPETVEMMTRDQLGELAPERWLQRKPRLSLGLGAAVEYSEADAADAPSLYGWVGGGFAKLWVDRREGLIAFIAFPLTPPGDNELLDEFQERVYAALESPGAGTSRAP